MYVRRSCKLFITINSWYEQFYIPNASTKGMTEDLDDGATNFFRIITIFITFRVPPSTLDDRQPHLLTE